MRLALVVLLGLSASAGTQEAADDAWIERAVADAEFGAHARRVFEEGDSNALATELGERFLAAARRFDYADVGVMWNSLYALRHAEELGRPAIPWLIAGIDAMVGAPAAYWSDSPWRERDEGRFRERARLRARLGETLASLLRKGERERAPIPDVLAGIPRPRLLGTLNMLRERVDASVREYLDSAVVAWYPLSDLRVYREFVDPRGTMDFVAELSRRDGARAAAASAWTGLCESEGPSAAVCHAFALGNLGAEGCEYLLKGLAHPDRLVRRVCLEGLVAWVGPEQSVLELEPRRAWLADRAALFADAAKDTDPEVRALAYRLLHDLTLESSVVEGRHVRVQVYCKVRDVARPWRSLFESGCNDCDPAVCFWASSALRNLDRDPWSRLRILGRQEQLRGLFPLAKVARSPRAELERIVLSVDQEFSDEDWAAVIVLSMQHLSDLIADEREATLSAMHALFDRRIESLMRRKLPLELFCYGEVEKNEPPRVFAWWEDGRHAARNRLFGRRRGWFGHPTAETVRQLENPQYTVRGRACQILNGEPIEPEVVVLSLRSSWRRRLAYRSRYDEDQLIESLGRRGLEAIAVGLDDPFPEMRSTTCAALGVFGSSARPWRGLVQTLAVRDVKFVRSAAARTLRRMEEAGEGDVR